MKSNPTVKNALSIFEKNELIFANKLYIEHLADKISEAAYYKTLERLCQNNELVKIAKGTYHLPKVSKYGIIPPSEQDIISAFTKDHTGVIIGYALYNQLNLTTQVPKTINVVSSAIDGFSKTIRNVVVHHIDLEYSDEIKIIVQGLDILQNYSKIQDINHESFLEFTRHLANNYRDSIFEYVYATMRFNKSSISFLREILEHYNVTNNLSTHLSSLSKYNHPTMEEIYESAQAS